jgi:hypothetical protein
VSVSGSGWEIVLCILSSSSDKMTVSESESIWPLTAVAVAWPSFRLD